MGRPSSHVAVVVVVGALLLIAACRVVGEPQRELVVGLLIPWTGSRPLGRSIGSAATIAADDINANSSILPNTTLRFVWVDTECDEKMGLYKIVNLWSRRDSNRIVGFVGPGCDVVCESVGLLASAWDMPIVSWGCTSNHLSDKDAYNTFARVVGPFSNVAPFVVVAMQHWGWNRVGILAEAGIGWQVTAETIKVRLLADGIDVAFFQSFEAGHKHMTELEWARHTDMMERARDTVRVIIICANGADVRSILLMAFDLDMINNGEYAFLTLEVAEEAQQGANTWAGADGRDVDAARAFSGTFNVHVGSSHTDRYKLFTDDVRRKMAAAPFYSPMYPAKQVGHHAALLYDAMLLLALAFTDHMEAGGDVNNGTGVAQYMANRRYNGMSNNVYIDELGNRESNYVLDNLQNGRYVTVATFHQVDHEVTFIDDVTIEYSGGVYTAPRGHPACGWQNEFCDVESDTYIVIGVAIGVAVIVIVIVLVGFFFYSRRLKFEHSLSQMDTWKIPYSDIVVLKETGASLSTLTSDGRSSVEMSATPTSAGTVYTPSAYYKGRRVALKKVDKQNLAIDRDFLIEMTQMRQMLHENLNAFIGVVIEPVIFILSNYCSKGSIQDVIENTNIKLDQEFTLSIASDICMGMRYIHTSPIRSHGHLKSTNCLIDSRWVCKITDFGLGNLCANQMRRDEETEYHKHAAPELLRAFKVGMYGTQKGDVYSYGIILAELVTQSDPHAMLTDISTEPKDLIERIKMASDPLVRPRVGYNHTCPALLRSLMQDCWAEDPEFRPTFDNIKGLLKKITGNKPISIIDNMMKQMEAYTANLEITIEARTCDLLMEKNKTDLLLYRMLPRYVADELKNGRVVPPESFQEVTVLFSDIVKFTKIASESTPMAIVDLLNALYTLFDDIIDQHDVYKVETIGDAYMVASGLPKPNGHHHAAEICSMALNLLHAISSFSMPYRTGEQLQLRIGAHTGSCVAGVVGLKMPRYCLFGDTVNTASRMESSGLALRVHLSESTVDTLRKLGGFYTEKRGEILVKGKGSMTTYWLIGKQGFDKVMPDLARAAAPEEHEFK